MLSLEAFEASFLRLAFLEPSAKGIN